MRLQYKSPLPNHRETCFLMEVLFNALSSRACFSIFRDNLITSACPDVDLDSVTCHKTAIMTNLCGNVENVACSYCDFMFIKDLKNSVSPKLYFLSVLF